MDNGIEKLKVLPLPSSLSIHIRPHSSLGYRPLAPEVEIIGALTYKMV
jgi:hypothetical protein